MPGLATWHVPGGALPPGRQASVKEPRDLLRQPILDAEEVGEGGVDLASPGPQVGAPGHQLEAQANTLPLLANRPGQHRIDAEVHRRIPRRNVLAAQVGHGCGGPDAQAVEAGEPRDQGVGQTEADVGLGVRAQDLEGEDGEGHQVGTGGPLDRAGEAVAAARNGLDPRAAAFLLAERAAQRRDGDAEVGLLDRSVGPHAGHQVGLGDEVASGLDEDL